MKKKDKKNKPVLSCDSRVQALLKWHPGAPDIHISWQHTEVKNEIQRLNELSQSKQTWHLVSFFKRANK